MSKRTQGFVVVALALFLFWLGLAAQWTQLSALFLKRECVAFGIKDNCKPSANHTVTYLWDGVEYEDHDATFKKAEKAAVGKYKMFLLVQGLLSLFMCPVIGALSDSHGRKRTIIFCLAAETIAILGVATLKDFNWLLVSQIAGGLGGGQYAITAVIFAVTADLVSDCSPSVRTKMFGVMEAVLWFGLVIGPYAGGALVNHFGMLDNHDNATILLVMALPSLLAIFIMSVAFEETLKVKKEFEWTRANIFGAFYLLGSKRLSLHLSIMCLLSLTGQTGMITILQLYASLVFEWTAFQSSLAMSIMFASASVGVAVMLQLLLKVLDTKYVVMTSISWAVCSYTSLTLVNTGWQLQVVLGCFLLNGVYFPVLRSAIAGAFGEAKYGRALGAMATMQQLTQSAAPPLFSQIFESSLSMNVTIPHLVDNNFGPRMSFGLIPAGLNFLGLLIALCLPRDLEAAAARCRADDDNNNSNSNNNNNNNNRNNNDNYNNNNGSGDGVFIGSASVNYDDNYRNSQQERTRLIPRKTH